MIVRVRRRCRTARHAVERSCSRYSSRTSRTAYHPFRLKAEQHTPARSRTALRLRRDDRWCAGGLEGGGKQVAGRQTAVGPPFLGDGEDFLLGREVVELISGLDGLTEGKVAGQDDVFPLQRNDEGALHGPGTYSRDCGELSHELVVGQTGQDG